MTKASIQYASLLYWFDVAVGAVSTGLGYDSESDDEDNRQGNCTPIEDLSDSSDEDTVQHRIVQKKLAFEQKMRLLEERENGMFKPPVKNYLFF